ncbi:hypothetical protein [Micromonospora peucetia]|uniref:Uncharacterized protein n=1 Tax=Micromonospora peucetia TaxID=47871 RepID=A0A1C6VYZ4_9ACTN|nr:hypothetical protein [Micromonospora peucetia]SCL71344.1 hypothetical protein GA0070608_4617 [Micromonospora peucetia]
MDILYEARRRSLAGFLEVYDAAQVKAEGKAGRILLEAIANLDPAARVGIATVLLDDGAHAREVFSDGANPLHVMFGQVRLAPEIEAPLLRRLIDAGADVNAVAKKFGTPLDLLIGRFQYDDDLLAPYYDVLFSYDDLDLLKLGAFKKSAYDLVVSHQRRPMLQARMEQHLRNHSSRGQG